LVARVYVERILLEINLVFAFGYFFFPFHELFHNEVEFLFGVIFGVNEVVYGVRGFLFFVGDSEQIFFSFQKTVDAVGVKPVLPPEAVDLHDLLDVLTLVFVDGFLLLVGPARRLVLLEHVEEGLADFIYEVVFAVAELARDGSGHHFALVVLVGVALD